MRVNRFKQEVNKELRDSDYF